MISSSNIQACVAGEAITTDTKAQPPQHEIVSIDTTVNSS